MAHGCYILGSFARSLSLSRSLAQFSLLIYYFFVLSFLSSMETIHQCYTFTISIHNKSSIDASYINLPSGIIKQMINSFIFLFFVCSLILNTQNSLQVPPFPRVKKGSLHIAPYLDLIPCVCYIFNLLIDLFG